MKRQPTEWELTANYISDNGLILRIYKALQLNNKIKLISLKKGKGLELNFLQRWYTNDQEAYEKTVNSASYQGKKNQTTVNTTSHPSGRLLFKRPKNKTKLENNKCWQRCGEIETSYSVGGITKWCSCYGKQVDVPQKRKHRTTIWSWNPTSGHVDSNELKSESWRRDICTPMFIEAFFTTARRWKQSRCWSTDEWINKMGYTQIMDH